MEKIEELFLWQAPVHSMHGLFSALISWVWDGREDLRLEREEEVSSRNSLRLDSAANILIVHRLQKLTRNFVCLQILTISCISNNSWNCRYKFWKRLECWILYQTKKLTKYWFAKYRSAGWNFFLLHYCVCT